MVLKVQQTFGVHGGAAAISTVYIFIADSSLHNKCLLWPALGADERGIFVKVLCVAACLLNRLLSISV